MALSAGVLELALVPRLSSSYVADSYQLLVLHEVSGITEWDAITCWSYRPV